MIPVRCGRVGGPGGGTTAADDSAIIGVASAGSAPGGTSRRLLLPPASLMLGNELGIQAIWRYEHLHDNLQRRSQRQVDSAAAPSMPPEVVLHVKFWKRSAKLASGPPYPSGAIT